jgi:hypothetical protein
MPEGASFRLAGFNRFFAIAVGMDRTIREVNNWFRTFSALRCTLRSAA